MPPLVLITWLWLTAFWSPRNHEHVAAAIAAATPEVDALTLLAVATIESDLTADVVSRPHGAQPPYYCGALQTTALTERACLAQRRDLWLAYRLGAKEIGAWLRDRRVRGDLHRALLGYGCGNHGVTTGRCNRYPERVIAVLRRLRA
jgi:hypothetical protein